MKSHLGWIGLSSLLSALLSVGAPDEQKPPAPREVPAKGDLTAQREPVTAPPVLDGKTDAEYLGEVNVANVPKGAGVVWDVSPEDRGVQIRVIKVEKAVLFAGPPGKYTVKCRIVKLDKDGNTDITDLRHTVTLTGGSTPTPPKPDPVPPGPTPPGPTPPGPVPPKPEPTGKVAKFVVVEDTRKAGDWRGQILGSAVLQAYYRQTGLRHRLVDVAAGDEGVPSDLKTVVDEVKAKDLPWLVTFDAAGKVITSAKAPTEAPAFVTAIGGSKPEEPGDLNPRAMGNKGSQNKYKWKVFGEHPNVPLIPRDRWQRVDLSGFLPEVKDQDGIGACNAFATVSATEGARAAAGLEYVRLSPGYLYGKINGGVDQGSFLEDGLAYMTDHGTVPTSVIGDLDWRAGRRYSGDNEAAPYRVLEAYECPNFDAMASALLQGFFVVEGLSWYNNFTPDRDGWLPAVGRGSGGGHALCGYGLVQRNGVWGISTRNSWSKSWGVNGNCVIPESLFGRGVGGFWAVRSVVQTPVKNWQTRNIGLPARHEFALAP